MVQLKNKGNSNERADEGQRRKGQNSHGQETDS